MHTNVAAAVLKVMLGPDHYADKWSWSEEKDGNFRAKSAHRLFKTFQRQQQGESSNLHQKTPFWKTLWKIRVPTKY